MFSQYLHTHMVYRIARWHGQQTRATGCVLYFHYLAGSNTWTALDRLRTPSQVPLSSRHRPFSVLGFSLPLGQSVRRVVWPHCSTENIQQDFNTKFLYIDMVAEPGKGGRPQYTHWAEPASFLQRELSWAHERQPQERGLKTPTRPNHASFHQRELPWAQERLSVRAAPLPCARINQTCINKT